MSDINDMLPAPATVTIRGKQYPTPVVKIGKLGQVVSMLVPFAGMLPKAGQTPTGNPINIMKLVMDHTDAVIDLVALLTGLPKEEVADMESDDFMVLVTKVVEVNLDFFIQRVIPSVSQAMVQLGKTFHAKAAQMTGP